MTRESELAGRWCREGHADPHDPYPAELEFRPGRVYVGRARDGALVHPVWDAGSYRVLDDGRLMLSTSNGANVAYGLDLDGDRLTLVVPDGARVRFRSPRGG